MSEPALRGPTSPAGVGEASNLFKLIYDPTGLVSVEIVETPIVAWVYDQVNPNAGATPVAFSGLPPAAPNTGAIQSPQWAVLNYGGVFAAGDTFVGTFTDFLTWLATNNGANRRVTAQLGTAVLINLWNRWSQ